MKQLFVLILVCISGCASSTETDDQSAQEPSTCASDEDCESTATEPAPAPAPVTAATVHPQTNDLGPDNIQ